MSVTAAGALSDWWASGNGGPAAYSCSRTLAAVVWRAAVASLPRYEGPEAVPPPDRSPPLLADSPEIRAYRALLQDRGTPMDTSTRRVRALTQAAQDLDRRPLLWCAEDVAERCARLAELGEGVWALLEAVREFWDWHPDGPWVDAQRTRMSSLLAVIEAPALGEPNA